MELTFTFYFDFIKLFSVQGRTIFNFSRKSASSEVSASGWVGEVGVVLKLELVPDIRQVKCNLVLGSH